VDLGSSEIWGGSGVRRGQGADRERGDEGDGAQLGSSRRADLRSGEEGGEVAR
jgi:hypothetical protein